MPSDRALRLSAALTALSGPARTLPGEALGSRKALPAPRRGSEFDFSLPGRSRGLLPAGEVVWLARLCAIADEGWVHSYIADGQGGFRLGEGIRMPEIRWRQFKQNAVLSLVDVGDMSQEECPYCGATCRGWDGPVLCKMCKALVCFGRTTADGYFHCRPSCGGAGQLAGVYRQAIGFVPMLHRGGNPRQ